MRVFLLSCLLLTVASTCEATDFDYGAYRDSSLAAAGSDPDISPTYTWWLDASHPKYHSVATFTGHVRSVSPETRELIEHWAKSMGHDLATAAMFTSEIEVRQADKTYWLPIQEALIAPIRREVPAGRSVHLYFLLIGAYKGMPVFGINEFDAVEG